MKISGKVNDDRLMDGGEKYGGVKRIKLDSEYLKVSKEEKIWLKWIRWGKRMGCHQKAERSFFFRGYQFPVCARCTGVLTASIAACAIFSVYRLE